MNTSRRVTTRSRVEVINITTLLAEMIGEVSEGLAYFYTPHTTAALIISEDESGLCEDLIRVAETWLSGSRPFIHSHNMNPNTEAHVLSTFAGAGITLAIIAGRLDLGRYQNALLLELDGPKTREIRCKVIPG